MTQTTEVLPPQAPSRLSGFVSEALPPTLTFIAIIAVWQAGVTWAGTPAYILPSPSRIWQALWAGGGSIFYHSGVTMVEAVAGFLLGSMMGVILGTVFAYSRLVTRSLMPFIIAANTIPVVAIAPIIILWFGNGLVSKIAVTAFLSFFPLALNMMKGLQSYDRTVMQVFHVAAATDVQRFLKMRLPSSLPYVFVGLKLNVTFSVIGAIVAEFVQADRGLGFVIMAAYRTLNMPRLWAAMLMSAVIGIVFFAIVALLERWLIPWHSSIRDDAKTG
ncbi:ABC transporter permease [Kaistia adipata]|uniref:ABC transporter permease n=1 Tax=Kaistia adipata TaxID=166954 RepID=UPI000412A9EE|nr:ABC transporter permease [Kaistia adipata]